LDAAGDRVPEDLHDAEAGDAVGNGDDPRLAARQLRLHVSARVVCPRLSDETGAAPTVRFKRGALQPPTPPPPPPSPPPQQQQSQTADGSRPATATATQPPSASSSKRSTSVSTAPSSAAARVVRATSVLSSVRQLGSPTRARTSRGALTSAVAAASSGTPPPPASSGGTSSAASSLRPADSRASTALGAEADPAADTGSQTPATAADSQAIPASAAAGGGPVTASVVLKNCEEVPLSFHLQVLGGGGDLGSFRIVSAAKATPAAVKPSSMAATAGDSDFDANSSLGPAARSAPSSGGSSEAGGRSRSAGSAPPPDADDVMDLRQIDLAPGETVAVGVEFEPPTAWGRAAGA
ncbi:hypothetical protein HK405_002085, partial [Cladochytrium tenue]